jgi:hypothetical protein
MRPEGQKLKERILDELVHQFPGSVPTIIDISQDTFRYQLERNDNYVYYLVEYTIDSSGNPLIDWKKAEQFML